MGSWEQVQVKLLEKHICGSLKMGIFLYSMLLFWCDDCKGVILIICSFLKKTLLHLVNHLFVSSSCPWFDSLDAFQIVDFYVIVVGHFSGMDDTDLICYFKCFVLRPICWLYTTNWVVNLYVCRNCKLTSRPSKDQHTLTPL